MTTFDFFQDSVVKTTERAHFSVAAASYEEALERIRGFRGKDVDNHEGDEDIFFGDFESLYEGSRKLAPKENDGLATITIYDEDSEEPITENS